LPTGLSHLTALQCCACVASAITSFSQLFGRDFRPLQIK
jgi:hypothetical protein